MRRGLTLIEVVVAAALLAVIVGACLPLVAGGAAGSRGGEGGCPVAAGRRCRGRRGGVAAAAAEPDPGPARTADRAPSRVDGAGRGVRGRGAVGLAGGRERGRAAEFPRLGGVPD
ncbi:MAG: prepilin-type N-terminal cleavage/methylation domain-containing protein [Phycisphaerales bacterium]|nr:prepilin-type N-terminal cleavage/methylation domain-containing protein [Phycisphaerales bacterium]